MNDYPSMDQRHILENGRCVLYWSVDAPLPESVGTAYPLLEKDREAPRDVLDDASAHLPHHERRRTVDPGRIRSAVEATEADLMTLALTGLGSVVEVNE